MRARVICFFLLIAATAIAQEERFMYPLPDAQSLSTTSVTYLSAGGKGLKADIYRPKGATKPLPLAVFLNGIGADWIRAHPQYSGWASLVTTVGFAGVAMDSDPAAPDKSFDSLVDYLRAHASELKVDPNNIVVYSCSSNVRAGLPLVSSSSRPYIRGAIVYYGSGDVMDFRFDLPVLVARAGLDNANLNRAIDDLIGRALKANAPWTILNVHGGLHGFEVLNDNEQARAAIRQTLRFMQDAVNPAMQSAVAKAGEEAAAAAAEYAGNWQEAVRRYTALTQAKPFDSYLSQKLGEALLQAGETQRGISELRRTLELGTRNKGLVSYTAAVACMRIGDSEGALGFLERLKDIPPMRDRVKNDAAFESLRSNPRFKAVIGT